MTIEEAIVILALAVKSTAGGEHQADLDRVIAAFSTPAQTQPQGAPA